VSTTPGEREGACMVYDPFNNVIVLFGGDESIEDTWFYDYDTNSWTEHSGSSPPGRINAAMVYCSESNEMIMYGGLGDTRTWSFDCETQSWSTVTTAHNPGTHQSLVMAYDSVDNVVILYGGITSSAMTAIDDVWMFDCETRDWTELLPLEVPTARYGHVMTYDASVNRMIMAFGLNYSVGFLDDTWSYDVPTNTWSEIDYSGAPGNLKWSSMVYDSIGERNILFGGCKMYPSYEAVDDTIAFDAETNTWINLEPSLSPVARLMPGLAFDSEHNVVVLHGGINAGGDSKYEDTWIYSCMSNTWTEMDSIPDTTTSTSHGIDTSNGPWFPDLIIATIIVGIIAVSIVVVVVILLKKRT